MKIEVPTGRYVLAVSGGVDSMVLLDLLTKRPEPELIVAHFNHGIRVADAAKDEEFVKRSAKDHGLKFAVGYGRLGAKASEEQARNARYTFLEGVKNKYNAKAIITAHHQDDLIETAIINILRGSGRRGLTAIKDNPNILRPLIGIPKKEIVVYANSRKLHWHDDSTNNDPRYLRNYVRMYIIPGLSSTMREELVKNIEKVAKNKPELDNLIATLSHSITDNGHIDRSKFLALPPEITTELMTFWLRTHGLRQFDRKTIERLNLSVKTAKPNTEIIASKNLKLVIGATSAHFSNR